MNKWLVRPFLNLTKIDFWQLTKIVMTSKRMLAYTHVQAASLSTIQRCPSFRPNFVCIFCKFFQCNFTYQTIALHVSNRVIRFLLRAWIISIISITIFSGHCFYTQFVHLTVKRNILRLSMAFVWAWSWQRMAGWTEQLLCRTRLLLQMFPTCAVWCIEICSLLRIWCLCVFNDIRGFL